MVFVQLKMLVRVRAKLNRYVWSRKLHILVAH